MSNPHNIVMILVLEWTGGSESYGDTQKNKPVVYTTTPGDLCREFMGSESAIWVS